jgi:hypothetical protein
MGPGRSHEKMVAVAVAISAVIACSAIACRQTPARERLIRQQREVLLRRIEEERAIEARFQKLGPGTPASEIVKEFGRAAATLPCSGAVECWYYDISSQKYFVCFDDHRTVTCHGRASTLNYRSR